MESPVPASMFAPEPSSPGAARAAAAVARLHGGFDSDCSEDGEALNGEPELDLTSKVGLGAGAKRTRRRRAGAAGRAVSGATAGAGGAARGRPAPRRPSRAAPARPPDAIRSPRRRHVERGLPTRPPPQKPSAASPCTVRGRRGRRCWGRGDRAVGAGTGGVSDGCWERKQKVAAQSGRGWPRLRIPPNETGRWAGPIVSPSWEWNHILYEGTNEGPFKSCFLSSCEGLTF